MVSKRSFKKTIFVIPDKTTINNILFTSILIGDWNYPNQIYLVDVSHTRGSVDSFILLDIYDAVLKINSNRLDLSY